MKPFRTISILVLAFLVLLSSSNFMVGIHFCADEIQNIGFLTKAEACEKEQNLPPCHKHMTAPCCEDATIMHEGDELKASASDVHVGLTVTTEATDFHVVVAELIPSSPLSQTSFLFYDPPRPSPDITITNQVFLI